MNANAYGGQLAEVLEWVDVFTATGRERRTPDPLGFAYRSSNLSAAEVVARVAFSLRPDDPAAISARLDEMRGKRREAQPSGIKTFGSTFKNPDDERAEGRSAGQLLEAAGCRGLRPGGARFSEKHANFVENIGRGDDGRHTGLMAEGRRRVHERFGVVLEPEVQVLGEVRWPEGWDAVRWLRGTVGVIVAVILVAFVYQRLFGDEEVAPRLVSSEPVAVIGSGSSAVAVAADGTILAWLPAPKEGSLPKLPLEAPPKGPRLKGPVLEQARVLGAAPAALRPYVESSYYGESGVDVNLTRESNCASATPPRPPASGGRQPRCSPTPRSRRSIM